MGNITRKAAIDNIHKAIKSLYRNTFKPDGHLVYISENMDEHKIFHDKVERLYNLSKSKTYNLELECLSFENLSLYYNKIKKLSETYKLDNYPEVSKTMLINKEDFSISNRHELEKMDKSNVIRYFYALMKVYAFEALESNCEETQKLKLEYLDPSVKDKKNIYKNLEEIKSVYDINNKKIKELKSDIQKNETLRNSIRPVGGYDFSEVASQFQKNIEQDNANICILQYQNMLLTKKYPEILFVKKNKNVPEELQEGFRKVEEAQDKLFEDIKNDNVPLIQIDFIREKALETIKSEYKNEESKIQLVLKEIKNKQTVEFWINVGRTAVPLILAAAMFFTPAGSALAIAVATGSAVTDISASIWDFHDARISNELAYSSAIGNEFSSTSMASADFQYGMAIFNMVLSAVSISEIKNATKAYNTFSGLSEDAQKLLRSVKPATGKRLLKELEEGELTKLLTVSESQFEKMSKLSTKQLKEVLNSAEMNDILKAVDGIPVDKFDDVKFNLWDEINQNPSEIVQKSGSKGNWNNVLNKELEPNKVYKVDAYNYHTDSIGRVDNVSGNLEFKPKGRNQYQQGKAVELKNGLKGEDDGGHIIAQIFNGPGEQINYVPQTQTLNRGDWKVMENEWKEALRKTPPDEVKVDIQIIYAAESKRPSRFIVNYTIGGVKQKPKQFFNK